MLLYQRFDATQVRPGLHLSERPAGQCEYLQLLAVQAHGLLAAQLDVPLVWAVGPACGWRLLIWRKDRAPLHWHCSCTLLAQRAREESRLHLQSLETQRKRVHLRPAIYNTNWHYTKVSLFVAQLLVLKEFTSLRYYNIFITLVLSLLIFFCTVRD